MSSNNELNSAGQICLAGLATFAVNIAVHPLCTLKNRLMANKNITHLACSRATGRLGYVKGLYSGFASICLTETAYNAATYIIHDQIERRGYDRLLAATAAGVIATPLSAFGESLMVNRQVNNLSYLAALKKAASISGNIATLFRDVPFTTAVLGGAPLIEKTLPISNDSARQIFAGIIAGTFAGIITTPVDMAKTLVQADDITLVAALRRIQGDIRSPGGLGRIVSATLVRASYIGLSVAVMNLCNNQFAKILPDQLRRKD